MTSVMRWTTLTPDLTTSWRNWLKFPTWLVVICLATCLHTHKNVETSQITSCLFRSQTVVRHWRVAWHPLCHNHPLCRPLTDASLQQHKTCLNPVSSPLHADSIRLINVLQWLYHIFLLKLVNHLQLSSAVKRNHTQWDDLSGLKCLGYFLNRPNSLKRQTFGLGLKT